MRVEKEEGSSWMSYEDLKGVGKKYTAINVDAMNI